MNINLIFKNLFFFFIGIGLFLYIINIFDEVNLGTIISTFNIYLLLIVILLTILLNYTAAIRLKFIIEDLRIDISLTKNELFRIIIYERFFGQFFSYLVGSIASKYYSLKKKGFLTKDIIRTIAYEKLYELFIWLFIIILFTTIYINFYISLGFLIFLYLNKPLVLRLLEKKIKLNINNININKKILFLSLIKYLFVTFRFFIIIIFLNINLSFIDSFFGTSVVQLMNMISFTPSGLGFTEAGWGGYMLWQGIESNNISNFLVLQRIMIMSSILLIVFYLFIKYIKVKGS